MGVFKSKKRTGYWYVDGEIEIDGKRIRYHRESKKKEEFKSKKWCEEEEERIIKELKKKRGYFDYDKTYTLRDLEDDFLIKIKTDGIKERTIESIGYRMKNYYDKFFDSKSKIEDVFNERKVERFKAWLMDKELKTNFKNLILTNFQQLIEFACDRKVINYETERSLLKCVRKFKDSDPPSQKSIYTPPEDAKKVWENASSEVFQSVFQIFYYSGCRISEFLGIQKKDVSFSNKNGTEIAKVSINKQVFKQKGEIIPYLKNGTSNRDIYFINEVANALKEYIIKYKFDDNDLLFNFSKNGLRRELDKAFKKANVPHNTFHGFGRKSIATYLYISSGDIKLPQMLLGHKEVDMTLNTYVLNEALSNNLIDELTKIETK